MNFDPVSGDNRGNPIAFLCTKRVKEVVRRFSIFNARFNRRSLIIHRGTRVTYVYAHNGRAAINL